MKKLFRYNFNMIEVMLAIVIITLGIAGTLVLFPVGLNATKEATANNSLADIAEYLIAHIQAKSQTTMIDTAATGYRFKSDTSGTFCALNNGTDIEYDGTLTAWSAPEGIASETIFEHNTIKGLYLIRQMSGPEGEQYEDFTAIARVYLDRDSGTSGFENEYFPDVNKQHTNKYESNAFSSIKNAERQLQNYLIPVVVELSYPADVPYANREKRYFRFEIYNHLCQIVPAGS